MNKKNSGPERRLSNFVVACIPMTTSRYFTLWFTGLPCSGKTTLADLVARELLSLGSPVERLDGDIFRKSASKELGYSRIDREKNVSRAALAATDLMTRAIAVASFVSPYRSMRQHARDLMRPNFIEIYLDCTLEICEKRDTKGMYKRARDGKIGHFTGISDPYEAPLHPEIILNTHRLDAETCVRRILDYLKSNQFIK